MIAATRDTSTRSTPTPIAVTARRSEAEARREPRGGREVATQHQSEPHQRHGERRPQRQQWPERRPPAGNRVDLVGPAALLVGDLRLEREPCRFEAARGGAERLLPVGMRRLVEHTRLAHAPGNPIERVEGGHERLAARGEPGGDRALLGAGQQTAAAPPARHPNPAGGPLGPPPPRGPGPPPRPAGPALPPPAPRRPAPRRRRPGGP